MPQLEDTWRLEAEMFCGTETFRNHQDVKYVSTGTAIAPPDTADIVNAWVNFLRDIYFPDVTINTLFLREIWYKQGTPPHPEHPPIWTDALGLPGQGNLTFGGAHFAGYLPQQVCIFCKKNASVGRAGKMFMRNVLTEADVQSTIGGVWAFSPHPGGFDPAVFNTAATTRLAGFMTSTPTSGNWSFAVTHLEGIPNADLRTPYSSIMNGFTAVRPTWNKTSR